MNPPEHPDGGRRGAAGPGAVDKTRSHGQRTASGSNHDESRPHEGAAIVGQVAPTRAVPATDPRAPGTVPAITPTPAPDSAPNSGCAGGLGSDRGDGWRQTGTDHLDTDDRLGRQGSRRRATEPGSDRDGYGGAGGQMGEFGSRQGAGPGGLPGSPDLTHAKRPDDSGRTD